MRIGIGYDIHRLIEGRPLWLGGVEIPYAKGLLGHSDGDVLLHALSDALLGAAALGDIGRYFPDTDKKYKDASSAGLLMQVKDLIREKGYKTVNVDTVVIAEEPKISRFIPDMRKKIADILGIDMSQASVKATTNEGVGPIGEKEAIAGYAIVMLEE